MATESGFSRGWKGFVDHKWSKKGLGSPLTVLSSGSHYQEFDYASGCSRDFLNDIAPWRQRRCRQGTSAFDEPNVGLLCKPSRSQLSGGHPSSQLCATGPPVSCRRHVRTEHGPLRIGSLPASAMKKKRRRVLPETRRGSWKIVSAFLARVTSQKHPGRRMPSPTATSSPGSRIIRPV